MIRLIAMLLAAHIGIGAAGNQFHHPPVDRTVVFYSPHQDDETLAMGAAIAMYANVGWNVHVVLVTDGSASSARAKVHLSVAAFVAARTNEFRTAVKRLGVPASHIHMEGYRDNTLTVEQAATVIAKYEALYPGAMHITESAIDRHPDHAALGVALDRSGLRARWTLFSPYWPAATPDSCYWVWADPDVIESAAAAYSRIGKVSVPSYFAVLAAKPQSLVCRSAIP